MGDFSVIEQPGLLFVLLQIFPHFMSWYTNQESVVRDVLYQSVNLFNEVLQFSPEQMETDYIRARMYNIALQSLLDESCSRVLLKVLVHGSNVVQFTMENETNWYRGKGAKYINTIQMMLSLLMQLMKLKNSVAVDDEHFPLESFIYHKYHNLRVIKAVANLVHHPYSNVIPVLSVRLLRKFTMVSTRLHIFQLI